MEQNNRPPDKKDFIDKLIDLIKKLDTLATELVKLMISVSTIIWLFNSML